eukprot:TRINITY_DN22716_c0_g1_i1.p1 TRINITY_DN22716_c0_g1~~TRINITY_DN22716_c0_g1_i1.p1  ORF type:complete len:266 (+),score=33.21 TRINITY_DN22716_c0_g1_i1:90-887(+)
MATPPDGGTPGGAPPTAPVVITTPEDAAAASHRVVDQLLAQGQIPPGGRLASAEEARAEAQRLYELYLASTLAPPPQVAEDGAEAEQPASPDARSASPRPPPDEAALFDASSVLFAGSAVSVEGSRRQSGASLGGAEGDHGSAAASGAAAGARQDAAPTDAGSPRRPPPVDTEAERRILNIFNHYSPKQLPIVHSTLQQYRGHEEALLCALVACHGPEPGTEGGPPAPMDQPLAVGWQEVRRRGHVFYRHRDGQKQWARPCAPRE